MKEISIHIALGALLAVMLGVLAMFSFSTPTADGAAFTGTVSRLDTSTSTSVGPQAVPAVTLFQISADCDARVVSTQGSAIMLSFGEPLAGNVSSTTLSGSVGHVQAASTTVAYDAEVFGCGRWTAWGFATSTVTVSEF